MLREGLLKNLFLVLLLANLLAVGWQIWIVPPEVPPDRLSGSGDEPELALASPVRKGATAVAPSRRSAAAIPNGSAATIACRRIGPLSDGGLADAVGQRLRAEGIAVSQTSEEGQIWVGHWVQLENVGNRQQADQIVGRLSAGGLPDAYVLQATGPISISLGVFRSRERADKVVAEARKLGFQPTVTDRYRPGVQYWLLVRAPAGGRLGLTELARETGQIIRSDAVPCPPTDVGGANAFN